MKKRLLSFILSAAIILGTLSMAFIVYSVAESTDNITKTAEWTDDDKTKAKIEIGSTFDKSIKNGKILFLGALCGSHGINADIINAALTECAKYGEVSYHLFNVDHDLTVNKAVEGSLKKLTSPTQTVSPVKSSDLGASGVHSAIYEFSKVLSSDTVDLNGKATKIEDFDLIVLEFDAFRSAKFYTKSITSKGASDLLKAANKLKKLYADNKVIWILPVKDTDGKDERLGTYKDSYFFYDNWLSYYNTSGKTSSSSYYDFTANSYEVVALMAPEDYLNADGTKKAMPSKTDIKPEKYATNFPTLAARGAATGSDKIWVEYPTDSSKTEIAAEFLRSKLLFHGYETATITDEVAKGFKIKSVTGLYLNSSTGKYETMPTGKFSYEIDPSNSQKVIGHFDITDLNNFSDAHLKLLIEIEPEEGENDPFAKSSKVDTNVGDAVFEYYQNKVKVHEEDAVTPFLEKEKIVPLHYDANGGYGAPDDQDQKYSQKTTLSAEVPARNGHRFLGWAVSSDDAAAGKVTYLPGAEYAAVDSAKTEATLYAVWTPVTYTVRTFLGELSEDGTVTYGEDPDTSDELKTAETEDYLDVTIDPSDYEAVGYALDTATTFDENGDIFDSKDAVKAPLSITVSEDGSTVVDYYFNPYRVIVTHTDETVKYYPVPIEGTFDITEKVPSGLLYGGVKDEKGEFITGTPGTKLQPDKDKDTHYFLVEYDAATTNYTSFVVVSRPEKGTDDGSGKEIMCITDIYAVNHLPSTDFKAFGNDVRIVLAEDAEDYVISSSADSYNELVLANDEYLTEYVVKQEGKADRTVVAKDEYFGLFELDLSNYDGFMTEVGETADDEAWEYFGEFCIEVTTFWITPDNVKVTNRINAYHTVSGQKYMTTDSITTGIVTVSEAK